MKLITKPDQVLLTKAEEWDFEKDTNAAELEAEMIEMMQAFNGIGLAANQVGLLKRVFVIKLKAADTPFAMFNPKLITQSTNEQQGEEGCLSFPGLWLDIKRPHSIEAEYLDKDGKECKISLSGIDARCFLHELEHLDGIVFTKKVSPMKVLLAQKKQLKQRKRHG
jgi:peptide deformylase